MTFLTVAWPSSVCNLHYCRAVTAAEDNTFRGFLIQSPPMSNICAKCCGKVTAKSPGVLCSGSCGHYYHAKCVGLSSEALKHLKEFAGINWICEDCHSVNSNKSIIVDTEESSTSPGNIYHPDVILAIESIRNDLNKRYDELKLLIIEKNAIIESITTENAALKKEVSDLSSRLDNLDQYSRRNNLEIQGVTEKHNENLLDIFQQIGVNIECPVSPSDVDVIHRVPFFNKDKKGPRNIIVKLKSRLLKDNFLAYSKALVKKNRNSGTKQVNINIPNISPKLYINEHLTNKNKFLLSKAKLFCRERNIDYIWVQDCKILARKNSTSRIVHIQNEECLTKLI